MGPAETGHCASVNSVRCHNAARGMHKACGASSCAPPRCCRALPLVFPVKVDPQASPDGHLSPMKDIPMSAAQLASRSPSTAAAVCLSSSNTPAKNPSGASRSRPSRESAKSRSGPILHCGGPHLLRRHAEVRRADFWSVHSAGEPSAARLPGAILAAADASFGDLAALGLMVLCLAALRFLSCSFSISWCTSAHTSR